MASTYYDEDTLHDMFLDHQEEVARNERATFNAPGFGWDVVGTYVEPDPDDTDRPGFDGPTNARRRGDL